MTRIFVGLFVSLLLVTNSNAQIFVNDIAFENTTYNFGTINFKNGLVFAKFKFRNNSKLPFTISKIDAECGCTVPTWPENAVQPGEYGVIEATFDPDNYAGEITKKLHVIGNLQNAMTITLYIKGIIRAPISANVDYIPGQFGYLRFVEQILPFGHVVEDKIYHKELHVVNDYARPLKIKRVTKKPDFLDISFSLDEIQPQDTATIYVDLNTSLVNDLGLVNGLVVLETNDIFYKTKSFEAVFELSKDFENLSKRKLKKAPKIELSHNKLDMGIIQQGAKKRKTLTIRNKGKSRLELLKIESDCTCAVLEKKVDFVEPGQELEVTVQFDSLLKSGEQHKYIYIYTNDPSNPKVEVLVHTYVKE